MKLCEAMDLVFTYSDGQRHAVVNKHRYYFYTLWTGTVWVLESGVTFVGGCGLCTLLSVNRDSLVFPAHIIVTILS